MSSSEKPPLCNRTSVSVRLPRGLSFEFSRGDTLPRQKGSSADLRTFTVTVDKVEEITGLDFFSSMLQPEQEELERTITVESWDRIKQGR